MSGEPVHSHIGPSGAHRWLNCSASVGFIDKLGLASEASGEEAARGTVAHFVCSECLINEQDAWEFAGTEHKEGEWTFVVDDEMVVGCQSYIDLVRATLDKYKDQGAKLYIEHRVRSAADVEAYGTSDCVIEVPGLLIIIIDFKNGRVIVEPSDEQLKLYGQYSYECRSQEMRGDGDVKDVLLVIHQPNGVHPKGPTREYQTTVDALQFWMDETVVPGIAETRNPDAVFTMGDWCKYCPALAHCALWQKTVAEVPLDFVDRTPFLSDEQISFFRSIRKRTEKFFESVDKEAFQRVVVQGKTIEGCKPVHKLGQRVWKPAMLMADPNNEGMQIEVKMIDAAIAQFGDKKIWPDKKIKSPAQLEKLPGGAAFVAQWASKPTTGMTLADEDDVREVAVGLMDKVDALASAPPVV